MCHIENVYLVKMGLLLGSGNESPFRYKYRYSS